MPSEKLRRAYWWALLLLCGLALLSYAALGWHTRMVADDYAFAYSADRFGPLESTILAYQAVSGRWALYIITDLLASEQPSISKLLIITYALLLMVALAALLNELREWLWPTLNDHRLVRWALSSLVVCAILSLCHPESLYWPVGSNVVYTPPIAFMMGSATLLMWGLRHTPTGLKCSLWGAGLGSLLMFTSGTHEIYAFGQPLLLSVVGLVVLAQPTPRRRTLLPWIGFAWGVALLGALIFFVAPGNWARLNSLRPTNDSLLGDSLLVWLDTARENFIHRQSLLTSGLLFLAFWGGFSLLPSPSGLSQLSRKQALVMGLFALLVAALWMGVVIIPAMLAYGYVPLRAQPPGMAGLVALSAVLALLWRTQTKGLSAGSSHALLALLSLPALLMLVANLQRLPDFMTYSAAWDAYDAAIHQLVSEGARELEVPPMPVRLGISDNEWLHEQRSWLNNGMARYYGLDDIRLNPEIDAVTRVR